MSIANVYFVDSANGGWVMVDAGVPGKAKQIRGEAESRYGKGTRPTAILLTHGHFDHAGNAGPLADLWDIPVYAHTLELPYLTGKSCYPPPDPTAPGFMAFLSRFFSAKPFDLRGRVRPLEFGNDVPGLANWEWHHTPGHTPGHVSFFRPGDATLLAGDAFTTVDVDSAFALATKKRQISRPPAPMTSDWIAAGESVGRLAALKPFTLACGHGLPMSGNTAAADLARFSRDFPVPSHGRYVPEPARADENGVTYLPPKPPDPVPAIAAGIGLAAIAGALFALTSRNTGSKDQARRITNSHGKTKNTQR
ncbi:MAG: MBL fold metallo-hydrolase [Bryobacteraceae bacterium]